MCSEPDKWSRGSHVSSLGVRKDTSPDEELKIIVFSPSIVLHYINEVLLLVSLGHLKYVHTGVYRSLLLTRGDLTHTVSTHGRRRLTQRFPTRIIRGSPAPFAFATFSRLRFFHSSSSEGWNFFFRKTKKQSNFHFPNLINYHQQTLQYQQLVDSRDGLFNSWLIRKSPYNSW